MLSSSRPGAAPSPQSESFLGEGRPWGAPEGSGGRRSPAGGRRGARTAPPPLRFPFLHGVSSPGSAVHRPFVCPCARAGSWLYLGGRCGSHYKPGRSRVTGHAAHVMPGRYK